ncbi:monocyte differentiation antigen CD14 isoform X2 [Cuculus canorus]|uniref:monocyte differentiation antigen CD14 isoform X2 n=1 Tax=Cuculus canorus TaxID=55661 RepID=UPI0023AA37D8|nr:monocyte differentiation antigen CD14 isoform X2 [Cuculus canorus]
MGKRWVTVSVAVLLLGLLEAEGQCFLNRTKEHCVCYNLSQESMRSIIQCLPACVVEFQGGDLERYILLPISDPDPSIIEMLNSLLVRKIIFGDLLVPEILLARVLRFLSYTKVEELVIENCIFEGRGNWDEMIGQHLPVLSLSFHNVTSVPLMGRQRDLSHLSVWLGTLQDLAITGSHVTSLPCAVGRVFRALRSLDMAQNSLEDESLMPAFCEGAFPRLRLLSLRRNNLTSYHNVCKSLRLLPELQHLDLSQNKLLADPSSSCQWPASLQIFNLSDTSLVEVLTPLPPSLEVLDMSCNHLHTVDISLSSLRRLFLSQNALRAAPSIQNYPMLDTLHLDNNSITELLWDEVKLLERLRDVTVASNPFNCSCSGAGALQALAARGHLGQGWPQVYTCVSPPRYQGWTVQEVPVLALRCNRAAVIAPLCIALLLLGVAGVLCLVRSRPGLVRHCHRA